MTIRPIIILAVVGLWFVVAASITSARAAEADVPLPALPHTVGMSGPDVDLIESGIAAFRQGELAAARRDFERALAIRSQTAVATFNLGVTEYRLGERAAGERLMQRGLQLAHDHGMSASPQADSMRAIARALGVDLDLSGDHDAASEARHRNPLHHHPSATQHRVRRWQRPDSCGIGIHDARRKDSLSAGRPAHARTIGGSPRDVRRGSPPATRRLRASSARQSASMAGPGNSTSAPR